MAETGPEASQKQRLPQVTTRNGKVPDQTISRLLKRRFAENAIRWHDSATFAGHVHQVVGKARVYVLTASWVQYAVCRYDCKHNRQFYIVKGRL